MRIGFRRTALTGMSITAVAAIALAVVSPWPNPFSIAAVAFVLGFGLGWSAAPTLIAAQASVGWGERGAVTGMNAFARSAGSALGVAVFGAISNSVIAQGAGPDDPETIISASVWVFIAAAVVAVLTLVAAAFMPRDPAGAHSAEPRP
jgi:MFS family permease